MTASIGSSRVPRPSAAAEERKSPKPSTLRQAASSKGELKKAEARWARWCSTACTRPRKRWAGQACWSCAPRPRMRRWLRSRSATAGRPGPCRRLNSTLLSRCALGSRETATCSRPAGSTPACASTEATAASGSPAQCLTRFSRSSSTPAAKRPSTRSAAAASAWKALSPRTALTGGRRERSGRLSGRGGRGDGGQRLLARRLELVARLPGGHARRAGHARAEVEHQLQVFHRAREVPVVAQLVRGLVIVVGLELLLLLLAPARGFADHVGAGVEVGGGHADAREVELVGAVEEAAVGELVRHHAAPLGLGQRLDVVVQARLAQADHREVAGAAVGVDAVDVDVRRQ